MEELNLNKQTFVLVKIRLSTQAPSPKKFYDYLRTKIPSHVESIELIASFEGSHILLLKVPVIIWSNLRDNPAYAFVDYVKSGNGLIPFRTQQEWKRTKDSSDESVADSVFSAASKSSTISSADSFSI